MVSQLVPYSAGLWVSGCIHKLAQSLHVIVHMSAIPLVVLKLRSQADVLNFGDNYIYLQMKSLTPLIMPI
jgi:hypothetical protein